VKDCRCAPDSRPRRGRSSSASRPRTNIRWA
jgi:hypothetical protein